ncbi:helix-turn-helix domain-containing protein [Streptomyces sp. enrichment culture]|uniref:helix-turn-helix domain-containing protein n=1 Tax=Streptomyces sp. enrichment culture TaxID=1795815 RepID=UPI003F564038
MSVNGETDEPGWEVDPEDEWGVAVITTVGRQLKLRREARGMRAGDFGVAIGYGEDLVYKVEGGRRIPRREYLERADQVLDAGGLIAAAWEDVKKVRYPKYVRNLTKLESRAVESLSYGSYSLHGLLQTEEYARALLARRRPALTEDEVESAVAARMGRKAMLERVPAPALSFVQEEVTLQRPVGGRMVLHRQLEHLLEVAKLRHVEIQVMLTSRGDHPGEGRMQVLKFDDGTAIGRADDEFGGRPVSDPRQLRILELRYGSIRADALPARESVAFIEQLLGET